MERRYTLSEIDRMRESILHTLADELLRHHGSYSLAELENTAEARLRTYMIGGVDPIEFGKPEAKPRY